MQANNTPSPKKPGGQSDLDRILSERSAALRQAYKVNRKKQVMYLIMAAVLLFVLLLVGLSVGGASFNVAESWRALITGIFTDPDKMERSQQILWKLRVPRVLMAIVSGIGLSVAGLVMQTVLRNPLASPYTLGISSAASFGAALCIVTGLGVNSTLSIVLPKNVIIAVNAFFFSLLCTFLIYILSKTQRVTAETLVLFGVAMNFLFEAATSFLQYVGTEEELAELVYWMFGSLSKTTWNKLLIASVTVLITVILTFIKSWDFNALMMGDETAGSLGLNVERLRVYGLVVASFSTSVIVSLLGPIGFIGLVAPHLGRILIGTDHRFLVPMSCLLGGCLLLGADIVGNVILAPQIVPVGIVTSFVGVPLLVYLVTRRRTEYWQN